MRPCRHITILCSGTLFLAGIAAGDTIASPTRDSNGFLVHTVTSEFQESPTSISVLLPDKMVRRQQYRVLYVLPVEAGEGTQFGHGLQEVKRLDLHNRYGLICVYPTFAQSSWFADNPLNPRIRQESYFVNTVVPFVEREYPAIAEADARLLIGFRKSGWGAFTLLLRHPQIFGKAAAWDAPVDQTDPTQWRYFAQKFGTVENFQNYRIDLLLRQHAPAFRSSSRFVLMGYGTMREFYPKTHELMRQLEIPHEFRDGPQREHRWDSGWLAEAVQLLEAGDLKRNANHR